MAICNFHLCGKLILLTQHDHEVPDLQVHNIVWAAVFGVFGPNFIFNGVDQLIQPANSASQTQFVQSLQAQIEQGADPSAIAPATASGVTTNALLPPAACQTGSIEFEGSSPREQTIVPYVNTMFENVRYGQLETSPTTYFVQYGHQTVTLTQIDRLPTNAEAALKRAAYGMLECQQESLVIEAMLSSEYLRDREREASIN